MSPERIRELANHHLATTDKTDAGKSLDAFGYEVIGEQDIHTVPKYHPTDYYLQRGKDTFLLERFG